MNQGKLVSDDIVLNLLSNRLSKASESGENGFILDGFPRTCSQAVSLWSACYRPSYSAEQLTIKRVELSLSLSCAGDS